QATGEKLRRVFLGIARKLEHIENCGAEELRFGVAVGEPTQLGRNVFEKKKVFVELADEHLLGGAIFARLRRIADELRAFAALGGIDFDRLRLRDERTASKAEPEQRSHHQASG